MTQDVRTFHGRRGRLGPRALQALDELLPRYGVACAGEPLDPACLFEPPLPVVVELGCGRGEATVALARREPDLGVIAVDVHDAGIAALLRAVADEGLTNVRVAHGDGVTLLRERIPSSSLVGIRAFFPDPWPKARHHKRRLIRTDLVGLMANRLQPGGWVHVVTDWPPYAEHMMAVLAAEESLDAAASPPWRPVTAYEQKARQAGRTSRDLLFRRR